METFSQDDDLPPTQPTVPMDSQDSQSSPTKKKKNTVQVWGALKSEKECFDLVTSEILLGRRKKSHIRLDDQKVSGTHCRIWKDSTAPLNSGLTVFLEDMSINGTFVNGKKVGKGNKVAINNGDEIAVAAQKGNQDCVQAFTFQDLTSEEPEKYVAEGEICKKYQFVKLLGTGNFSGVHLGLNLQTGEKRAIKVINKRRYWQSNNMEQLQREVEILRKVDHPNIIRIYEVFSTDRFIYIVLELASGGELFDHIMEKGSFGEDEAREIFSQMLGAVHYLHSNGIVHRDLKPENILFDSKASNVIKITDFGLARMFSDKHQYLSTLCGTPQYVAPEIVMSSQGRSNGKGYSKGVDMWSLGVILYILLSGIPPFGAEEEENSQLFKQIETGAFHFYPEYFCNVSEQAKDLIRKLLVVDPHKRLSVTEAMAHPWIRAAESPFSSPPSSVTSSMFSPVKQAKHSSSAPSPASVPGNMKKNISQLRGVSPLRSPEKLKPQSKCGPSSDTEDEPELLRTKTIDDFDKENDAPQKQKRKPIALDLDASDADFFAGSIDSPLKPKAVIKKTKSRK